MPWKVAHVSELRLALVQQVRTGRVPLAEAARNFGVSRKTAYKWLDRFRRQPDGPLADRSRRPRVSPRRCCDRTERQVLEVRDAFGWGARKIHAYLTERRVPLPSVRTVTNILRRHARITPPGPAPAGDAAQPFERPQPHALWQCDHKGPLEVARRRAHPFTVLDDHSRYLIACRACTDLSMRPAFDILWDAFGEVGLPEAILSDNAFGTTFEVPKTVSWFDARLIRLGIRPLHGRPYHPQTQGKVERLHGTLERELWPRIRRDSLEHFQQDLDHWRGHVYNAVRPHEALGDRPPVARFRPSPRPRPERLPPVEYPAGAAVRRVSNSGDVRWKGYRLLAGRGLVGELVRVEDRDHEVALFYAWKQIRLIPHARLRPGHML